MDHENIKYHSTYNELLNEKKRLEFMMTEGEILNSLIEEAHKISTKHKKLLKKLYESASVISHTFPKFIKRCEEQINEGEIPTIAIGIDGSFQVVGGIGGIWYAVLSSVKVCFPERIRREPETSYFATIKTIEAVDESQAKKYASYLMLSLETDELETLVDPTSKFLEKLNKEKIEKSLIFLDGPIIDPPFISETYENNIGFNLKEYHKKRIDIIKRLLESNNYIIGCTKRIRGNRLIKGLQASYPEISPELNRFYNDLHLVSILFKKYRASDKNSFYLGPLATRPFAFEEEDDAEKYYENEGIKIYRFFYQRDAMAPILQVEIAISNINKPEEFLEYTYNLIVKSLTYWTLHGHGLPLPSLLAHEKCAIREGCAQVLYEEIITKESSEEPTIFIWLR